MSLMNGAISPMREMTFLNQSLLMPAGLDIFVSMIPDG